ncbi:MAG: Bax inhibitor-1/YccA family protein [Alphaproteobacteria bacterium]|jgi:FtsH-binding integral membrane protein|nr:Bax inhibitor-1/YccA family protein [Alphaproteobacteria bacterium]
MAEYENQAYRARPVGVDAAAIDQGLRAYMISVYQYMALGVGLTGLVAYWVSQTPAIYEPIFGSGLVWVAMLAPVALVFVLSFGIDRMSAGTAQLVFWAYAALNGVALATIFLVYPMGDIARVFFISAATFGALSLYGYTTPRSLSAWGSFLFMGLVGVFIAVIVNIFLQSSALNFAISVIGVLVFAGLTAYDTQQIKEMYLEGDDSQTMGKKAIMGALRLYLDFINLFLMLLRLLGNRE